MVDFNNDATIGTPAIDIERISILQRRYDFIEALEDYRKKRLAGAGVSLSIVRARLGSLFYELQATFKRRLTPEKYNEIKEACLNSTKEETILDAFLFINEELDKISLIKIDTRSSFNFSIAEEDNKGAGL